MHLIKLFRRYKIEIAFAFATLVLLVAGLSSYRALESAKSSVAWVRHTYQVIGAIDDLSESLALVHSSGRSYVFTGGERYRRLNRDAVTDFTRANRQLIDLTRDNPEQAAQLPEIKRLFDLISQRSESVITARANYGPDRAIALLRSGEGARALDAFRQIATNMKDSELRLLDKREEQASQDFLTTQNALAGATILALILTASAGLGTVRDIRRRKKAEAELFLEKERAQVTLASIGDGVMRADATGNVTFLNRAGTLLTGWPEDEAVGKPLGDVFTVIDATTRTPISQRMQVAITQGAVAPLPETALLVRRDGKEVPIEDTVAPICDSEGKFTGAVNVFRDVSEAREASRRLRHVAHHDPLTGLPNRVLLDDRMGRAVAAADRHSSKVALLYLDLDGFKLINDTRGHAVGDELLKSVTTRLLACVRECDTVSRMGGDEFVILLTAVNQPEDAAITANRVLRSLSMPHAIDGTELGVTASIGISLFPDDARTPASLLSNADAAMYEAKTSGPAKYVFYPASAVDPEQRRA
jgi:diguanylate cyclase (GGDEF)-like protein/PAS domain S-box-containing protein